MRTIVRALWLTGNAALLASLAVAPLASVIVMGIADVVLAVAWLITIVRAARAGEGWWSLGMAVIPLLVWVYIFACWGDEQDDAQPDDQEQSRSAHKRALPVLSDVPLAARQAEEVIRSAERLHPDW